MNTRLQPCVPLQASARGFTLMELAVSLCVIALVLGSVIVPLQTQIETRKVDETRRLLDLTHEMLLGYAAGNGYFPCPADASSQGQEAPGSDHTTGNCANYHGYLPAALLGFRPTDAQGYSVDAWGTGMNRLRYAVAHHTVSGIVNPFTRVNGMRSVAMASLAATPLFYICQSGDGVSANDCGTAVTLASNAAVVVWSVGPNAASGGASVHEAQNPNPNGGSADRVFVSRGVSTVSGHEFDDLVTWIPVTALLSRLVSAGQFTPAAQGATSPAIAAP